MTSINFIKLDNAQTFSNKVSEKIDTKYIKDYINTQIQSQKLTLNANSQILCTYIKKIQSYQITVINSSHKNTLLEPYVFAVSYLNTNKNSLDLYIREDFFAVYENTQLVYFKEINSNSEKSDIINYVKQTFSLRIDNIYEVDDALLDEYKTKYISNIKNIEPVRYIKLMNNKNALFYLLYLLIVILVLGLYLTNIFNQEKKQIRNDIKEVKIEQAKNEYQLLLEKYEDNEKITHDIITLFNLLEKNGIKLIHLKLSEGKSEITIKAAKKEVLLDFLDFYDEDSTINNMNYNEEYNCYEMHATVKLYK